MERVCMYPAQLQPQGACLSVDDEIRAVVIYSTLAGLATETACQTLLTPPSHLTLTTTTTGATRTATTAVFY